MMQFDPRDCCRSAVLDIEPYRPGKSANDIAHKCVTTQVIKLSSNENMLGPSPSAIEAVRACCEDLMLYPDGVGSKLKKKLAKRHQVKPECVTLGNGSNELLELAGRCFLGEGTNAVYSEHAFAVYELTAKICGADSRIARALPCNDKMPYGHDLNAMIDAIDSNTRVVFIANPNNPTGTWFSNSDLESFLQRVPNTTIVVIDEAYAEYVTEPAYPEASAWINQFPNLLVTRTFSKVFGLAGLRIGYAVSSASVAELINRVRQPFNVSLPAQCGAFAALEDTQHLEKSIAMNCDGLKQLQGACEKLGLPYLPSVANFLCIEVGDNADDVYEGLLQRGVIVRLIANYGLPRYLRVTVGCPSHNRLFLDALEEVLKS